MAEPSVKLISAQAADDGFGMRFDLSDYGDLAGQIVAAFNDLLDAASAPNYLSLVVIDAEENASEVVICRPGVDLPALDTPVPALDASTNLGEYLLDLVGDKGVAVVGEFFANLHATLHDPEASLTALRLEISPKNTSESESMKMLISKVTPA